MNLHVNRQKNIAYLFVLQKGTVQPIVLSNIVPYIKVFPIGYLIVNHLSNYAKRFRTHTYYSIGGFVI